MRSCICKKNVVEMALEVLVPSWGELNISLAAAVLLLLLFGFLRQVERFNQEIPDSSLSPPREIDLKAYKDPGARISDTRPSKVELGSSFIFLIRLELLAAKNLVAANLNGTSDPYAIIECGTQKRFSSMVLGSRNPMWGEEFDFYVEVLPSQISISIYDWDIVWKSTKLGSMILEIEEEGQTEAIWHALDSTSGQVCVQTLTKRHPVSASGSLNGMAGAIARRRLSVDKPVGTEVRQKPGPLQTYFELPPDEVVEQKFSCALERSFLYHGRMFVSAWHVCFHSNVFSKQLKVVLPYEDVEEIKRSQHAFINPAITIILRAGSGGYGVPPLASSDGRAKYKFASFWNRNHAHRVLQRAWKNFQAMEEASKQERKQSSLRIHSSSFRATIEEPAVPLVVEADDKTPPEDTKIVQQFLKDDVLVEIIEGVELPCTAEEFFTLVLSDESKLTETYRDLRKDTELKLEQWHVADDYVGLVRKITYRSICRSPMCPPDTAMTDWQHVFFSDDKRILVFETIQQAHDVPFGSSFEVQARWTYETISSSTCKLNVKVGTNFKKRLLMGSKIRSGAESEYKADAGVFLSVAKKGIDEQKAISAQPDQKTALLNASQDTQETSSPRSSVSGAKKSR
ncbi:hypothetical protein O6H91_01G023400 [Diphasiastrum complanatum]|uniref:Uncharacterized protein n=1 Tax=Diphasiastrum complanatum TaxID=34168 RepID=A0ACC2ENZ7_DIPCM|nr:hypothetical protein O6H91_01G023400 [Diphasiastrum complanatum]